MHNIDPTAKISHFSDMEISAKNSQLHIGENSIIDSFVKIKFVGGNGDILIGKNCYINSGCVLYSGNGIQIGNNVLIAGNCTFAPVNHSYLNKSLPILKQGFSPSKGGILIEEDVWIGANTVILDGSVIPIGCVIASGSVVREKLQAYGVYAGNPLKLLKFR